MAAVTICSDFGAQENKVLCCDPTSNLVFPCILGKKKKKKKRLPISTEKQAPHTHTHTHKIINEAKPKALSETSKNSCQTPT